MDVITQILSIDQNAREKLARAYEEKKQIILEAETEKSKIQTELLERAEHRLELINNTEKKNSDEILEALEKKTSQRIEKLDAAFKQNHSQWEKEFFDKITKC